MSEKRHWKVASKETKRVAVALTGGSAIHKPGRPRRSSTPVPRPLGAPSKRTLRRWRKEQRDTGDVHEPLPKGHPQPLLSEGEKRVVGGWVLSEFSSHSIVSVESVRSWILGSWNKAPSHGYVVELMRELDLPSHLVGERELKYWNPNLESELLSFCGEIWGLLDS